jgi:hypothetical protein
MYFILFKAIQGWDQLDHSCHCPAIVFSEIPDSEHMAQVSTKMPTLLPHYSKSIRRMITYVVEILRYLYVLSLILSLLVTSNDFSPSSATQS